MSRVRGLQLSGSQIWERELTHFPVWGMESGVYSLGVYSYRAPRFGARRHPLPSLRVYSLGVYSLLSIISLSTVWGSTGVTRFGSEEALSSLGGSIVWGSINQTWERYTSLFLVPPDLGAINHWVWCRVLASWGYTVWGSTVRGLPDLGASTHSFF